MNVHTIHIYENGVVTETKSTFIRKKEAVNRVIQRYRSNYLQREESVDVGRKYKFIWWLSPNTGARAYISPRNLEHWR